MLSLDEIGEVKAQAYIGAPATLKKVCQVHPIKLFDIIRMGVGLYNRYLAQLLLTEVDISKIIKDKTGESVPIEEIFPLEFLIQSAAHDDIFLLELQTAFSTFVKEDILILPKINAILVGDPKEKRLITKDNFVDFQTILRIQNRKEDNFTPPPENESEIARKMRLKAEERDAIKRKQEQKSGGEQSLADLIEIAETYGIECDDITLYAFYGRLHRHQAKEKWEQDLQMLCAGADSTNIKTKYWGGSLEEK